MVGDDYAIECVSENAAHSYIETHQAHKHWINLIKHLLLLFSHHTTTAVSAPPSHVSRLSQFIMQRDICEFWGRRRYIYSAQFYKFRNVCPQCIVIYLHQTLKHVQIDEKCCPQSTNENEMLPATLKSNCVRHYIKSGQQGVCEFCLISEIEWMYCHLIKNLASTEPCGSRCSLTALALTHSQWNAHNDLFLISFFHICIKNRESNN